MSSVLVTTVIMAANFSNIIVMTIPLEKEIAMGQLLADYYLQKVPKVDSSVSETAVLELMKPLLEQVPPKNRSVKIIFVDSPIKNLAIFPGGIIVASHSLLKKASSADEIFGIAAHEYALLIRCDVLYHRVQVLKFNEKIPIVFGDYSTLGSKIVNDHDFQGYFNLGEEVEYRADKDGVDLLRKASIDPHVLANYFVALEDQRNNHRSLQRQNKDSLIYIFDLHDYIEKRIEHISKVANSKDAKSKFQYKYPQFNLIKTLL